MSIPKLKPALPVFSRSIKTVLVDLSGTLHIEDSAIPGAIEALNRLRETKVKVKFVTNTTKDSSRLLFDRLVKLGFNLKQDEIHSSLGAAKALIQRRNLKPMLFLSKEALEDFEGFNYELKDKPNAVVIGLAPEEFHYDRLNDAFRCLLDGAQLIAIHAAKYYKTSDGMSLGPGCFVKGLEYSTQCEAIVVGKPTRLFFETVLEGAKPEETIMIGDDVTDDIGGAQEAGLKGFLVKTGKYRANDETKINPEPFGIFDSFVQAVNEIERINKCA